MQPGGWYVVARNHKDLPERAGTSLSRSGMRVAGAKGERELGDPRLRCGRALDRLAEGWGPEDGVEPLRLPEASSFA